VKSVRLEKPVADRPAASCIARRFQTLTIPPCSGVTRLTVSTSAPQSFDLSKIALFSSMTNAFFLVPARTPDIKKGLESQSPDVPVCRWRAGPHVGAQLFVACKVERMSSVCRSVGDPRT
jgi:hypothetical protein